MKTIDAIAQLDRAVPNPNNGLPDDIFYYISRTSPLINVDLLIKDEQDRTLLAWRDDIHDGKGWHIPGGIIRYKEKIADRVLKVAEKETGLTIMYDEFPIDVNEIIADNKRDRGHFISLLYRCKAIGGNHIESTINEKRKVGDLYWFDKCPNDLLFWHEIYRKYI